MQNWFRFDDNEKDIFLEGFRAGFDVTRQGFNRQQMDPGQEPATAQFVADPLPQPASTGIIELLAARALAIAQCEHEANGAGFCTKCLAHMGARTLGAA